MSDLLNQASLVVIPSGYKEDTVYSVVPSDGSGDLSFTRASNGTRVNSAGLVEVCPWNLIEQSETFDNASWAKDAGSTITANSTTAPNGTITADTLNASAGSVLNVSQLITTTAGVYTYSIYLKKNATNLMSTYIYLIGTGFVASGEVNFDNGTFTASLGTGTIENVGNGWFKISLTQTLSAGVNSFGIINFSTTGTRTVYAWGAQLNIGSTAKPYFPTTDRLNVPRLTYQNGGGGCPSLLLEKQSTNLVVQSNDMTQWVNGAGTMTKNATTSPDGTNNALSFDNSGDCSTFATASNGVHAWSLFVKQGTSATASIDMSDGATGDVITTFTFSTKTFSGTSAGGSWTSPSTSYIDLGNGWYRITLTATKNAGSSIGHKIIASGSGYTYVYGAQLEASSYPTSYIPTTSASATRVADACSKTGISSLIGSGTGTWFMDFEMVQGTGTGNPFAFDLSDGTTSNRLFLYWGEAGQSWNWGGVDTSITLPSTLRKKIAVKYSSGTAKLFCNGSSISTLSINSAFSRLDIGQRFSNTFPMDGKVNEAYFLPTSLTDAECQAITTI
jgi:hypothetical protein